MWRTCDVHAAMAKRVAFSASRMYSLVMSFVYAVQVERFGLLLVFRLCGGIIDGVTDIHDPALFALESKKCPPPIVVSRSLSRVTI